MALEAPKSDFYQLLLDEHRMLIELLEEIAEALEAKTEPVEEMANTLNRQSIAKHVGPFTAAEIEELKMVKT